MQIEISFRDVVDSPMEVAERKGVGHPDTLCDAITEQLSVRLSRYN